MPGKDWHLERVKTQTERAKLMAQNLDVAANHPTGATPSSVDTAAREAHKAIDAAHESARIIVQEDGARDG